MGRSLLVSFNKTTQLTSELVVCDEDLVEWTGGAFQSPLYFDGSEAGVPDALDLDAAQLYSAKQLLLSFDSSGSIEGIAFHDEDILEYDLGTQRWALDTDPSKVESALSGADLDALVVVPEPAGVLSLLFGTALLFVLGRREQA